MTFLAHLPVPTGRMVAGTASIAVLVAVVPADPLRWWIAANAVLLAAFGADWAVGVRRGLLEVTRELPAVVGLGQEAVVLWDVRNPTQRRLRVHLADALAPSLRPVTRRVRLVVAPRSSARGSTSICPARRGCFEPGEIVLRVPGPLGLAARQERREVPGRLRVHPAFPSRREAELRTERSQLLRSGLRAAAGQGGGAEFDHLRDYTVDDDVRRIDWAATARASRPIVRTYRPERNQSVLLLLDTGRTMAARVVEEQADGPQVPRLEHALDAVMALTSAATRLGDRSGLVAYADEVRAIVPPSPAGGQLQRVVEALYDLQPRLVESDHQRAFTTTLSRFARRSLLVVVTELEQASVTETLMPALPSVLRDHVVIIAAARDAAVAGWAHASPADAASTYRKAAAVAALERRGDTVAQLRARGAVVVDERPGRLAPALVEAYLQIKATGRL